MREWDPVPVVTQGAGAEIEPVERGAAAAT